jgi:cell division protease FtsH
LAATNRVDILDPAILRPGRFDRKVVVGRPDVKGRMEILQVHAKGKPLGDDVDLLQIAQTTAGFTGADLENLLNEAAIISVQDKKRFIDRSTIDKAMMKVLLQGHIKENQGDRSKEELETVAWHEAGHALVGKLCGKEIPKVTILSSTSGAGGVTFTTPKETGLHSLDDLRNEVKELYAGRVAESLMSGGKKITTGASNDIEKATSLARAMVTQYGMSDKFGLMGLESVESKYLDGSPVMHCGEETSGEIDKEVMKILEQCYEEAENIIRENLDALESIGEYLFEEETISGKQFMKLYREVKGIPEPEEEIIESESEDKSENNSEEEQQEEDNK